MHRIKTKCFTMAFVIMLAGCSHKVTTVQGYSARTNHAVSKQSATTTSSVVYGQHTVTLLVKAGSNTLTQTLSNNTEFNIQSDGVRIKGMMLNGILNMWVGNKHIQLDGKQLRHYHFKNNDVSITIHD